MAFFIRAKSQISSKITIFVQISFSYQTIFNSEMEKYVLISKSVKRNV